MTETVGLAIYGVGVVVGLFVVGWKRLPFFTFDDYTKDSPFGPAWVIVVWPLTVVALPVILGRLAANLSAKRIAKRRLAEAERKKWLEAPLP